MVSVTSLPAEPTPAMSLSTSVQLAKLSWPFKVSLYEASMPEVPYCCDT